MLKALIGIPDRCRGCQRCMLHCSFQHYKTNVPSRAMIHVVRHKSDQAVIDRPVICIQCGICMNVCPTNAMTRDKTGALIANEEKCTSCGLCVMACPYGAIKLDPVTGKASKCDLCGGDPVCVRHCPFKALAYVDVDKLPSFRRRSVALGGLYV